MSSMIVSVDTSDAALAGLAEDVGQALLRYASRLRGPASKADPVEQGEGAAALPPTGLAADPVAAEQDDGRLRGLGASQKRVLEAVHAAGDSGTTANEVAAATGLKSTNTPRMLKALAERGLVASWGSNPFIWRRTGL